VVVSQKFPKTHIFDAFIIDAFIFDAFIIDAFIDFRLLQAMEKL